MEIIRQKQPKRAHGFAGVREFAHKGKLRRTASEAAEAMGLKLTDLTVMQKVSTKVDVARYNWPGLVGVQQLSGMYDPRPRLVKRSS